MLTFRNHGTSRPERGELLRRARATAVSFGLHVLLVVGLWQVLQFPRTISEFLAANRVPFTEQRLRYFQVTPTGPATGGRPSAQPAARPAPAAVAPAPRAEPTRIVAPTEVPTGIPAAPAAPRVEGPTSGPLVTGRGPVQGVQPAYTEPRIWLEPQPVTAPALTGDAKLDSAVSALIFAFRDSVATNTYAPNKFERGDWTYTTKDGKKYGMDGQFIRLGKVSIPTALLGLLPMNQVQGNPIAYDRQRRLDAMRVEILAQAQQAMNEEEFRRAVKQIRERKERERREAEKKKKAEVKVIS